VALTLTGSPDAHNFLAQLSPEDQPSKAALALGQARYDRLMTARRALIS